MKRFLLSILMILNIPLQVYSILPTRVDFLTLSIGARPTGMGEAFVGVYSDIFASYWNPAGLSKIKQIELGAMHSKVIDANLEFFGVAYPIPHYGILSISSIFYHIKPVPVTSRSGETLGKLTWLDWTLILSYGQKITNELSVGISGKLIQRLENNPIFGKSEGTTYAIDFGFIYETQIKGLNLGCAILNTGTDLQMTGETKKDALPQTTRAGLAYEYQVDNDISLIASSDLHKILESNWYMCGGTELNFRDAFFFRMGYFQTEGNVEGSTYGFGVKIKNFQFDYSNIPAGEMVGYTRSSKISFVVRL